MKTYSCGPTSSIIAVCLLVSAIDFWNGSASAKRYDDRGMRCGDAPTPKTRMSACNALIQSRNVPSETRGDALHSRAWLYVHSDKTDLAIADFSEAIPLRDRIGKFHSYQARAEAYWRKNDFDRAIADFSEAIEIKGVSSLYPLYSSRAHLYRDKKEYGRAISDMNDAIRSNESSVGSKPDEFLYIQRGEIYMEMKAYDLAIADFRVAANNKLLGNAYYQKGDFNRAIAEHTEAIRANPDSGPDYLGRGKAHENLGEFRKALVDFRTALNLYRDDKDAADSLKRVEQKLSGVSNQSAAATMQGNSALKQEPNAKSLDCNDLTTIKTTDDFYSCANKSAAVSDKSASPAAPSPPANQKSAALTEDPFITKAKAAVKARVSDPDSARFQSVELRTAAGKAVACGIVIQKNSSTGKMDPYSFAFDGEQMFIKFVIAESNKKATGDIAQIVDAYFRENTAGYNRLCN